MTYFHYEFDPADHLTVGTTGKPGQRTFFLQAGKGVEFVSLVCEKEQMAALGEGLLSMLDQIDTENEVQGSGAAVWGGFGLVEPIILAWRVAQMGVGYDNETDRVVIIVQESADEPEDAEMGRFTISREFAEAFAMHVLNVVAAGRPMCPMCGEPMEPDGHWCVKTNGHGKHYVQ